MKNIALIYFLVLSVVSVLYAQEEQENTIRIESIDSHAFPQMKAYVSVEDQEGSPNLTLVKGNFSAKIDTENHLSSLAVETFNKIDDSIHYVFFLSASGLMDGQPLTAQKNALLDFSTLLGETDSLSAYIVGEQPEELFSYVLPPDLPSDAVLELEVREDQAKIFDTLVGCVRKIEKEQDAGILKKNERTVFILLSDGRDNESRFTLEQTAQVLSESGIPLYSLGLKVLSEASLSVLHELARKSGGSYLYTPDLDTVSDHLNQFAELINMSYVVSFRAKGVKADDSFHQLMIQVDDKELSIQGFRNFKAVKNPFPLWLKLVLLGTAVVLLALGILLMIFRRMSLRKKLGISKRKCPDCKRRMKDDWEFCPFCRYLPGKPGKKKKTEESA